MSDDGTILRTVYLPRALDIKLQQWAFTTGLTRSELIAQLLAERLKDMYDAGERTIAEQLSEYTGPPFVPVPAKRNIVK